MSKGYAVRYFTALGQSDRARDVPVDARRAKSRDWPKFGQWAYHDGWTWNFSSTPISTQSDAATESK
jgi:hypothetical protein